MKMMKKRRTVRNTRTLYIKNPVAHRLAEQVSKEMGVTLSDAVISALEDKVKKTGRPLNHAKLDELYARFAALPVLDNRPAEEILDYDEFGLPR